MAVIHHTTMTPTKLELLASWLPAQPWYAGPEAPAPTNAGGFRLDDPEGEVGIEFMVVADDRDGAPVAHLVPMTYRGAPLEGAEQGLIGTSEHGVLGTRWIYDGTHDPVLVTQLLALLRGDAVPQAQSLTDTPDETVTASAETAAVPADPGTWTVHHDEAGTRITLEKATLHIHRALTATTQPAEAAQGHVTAGWTPEAGTETRSAFVTLHPTTR
ncbi:1,4-alpha-glucan branching protein [Streptomyces coeruleoprunus]|uniref:1,4-alpha-glucan branching protein n=1 Tax=Streptomyces coeruleoprunus TaxID=285563 RepID=A0ABV9XDJ1_9ACTN